MKFHKEVTFVLPEDKKSQHNKFIDVFLVIAEDLHNINFSGELAIEMIQYMRFMPRAYPFGYEIITTFHYWDYSEKTNDINSSDLGVKKIKKYVTIIDASKDSIYAELVKLFPFEEE